MAASSEQTDAEGSPMAVVPTPQTSPTLDDGDEVSRQRRRRTARLLEGPVAGFPDLIVADVVAMVAAAGEESGGRVDAAAYLAGAGFPWQTSEAVLAYLSSCGSPELERNVAAPGHHPSRVVLDDD